MMPYLYVLVGGGIGSMARFYLSTYNGDRDYPVGTALANLVACLALGYFINYFDRHPLQVEARLLITVGVCGGLSTFSTFIAELYFYYKADNLISGLTYLLGSIFLGSLAFIVGTLLHTKT